MYLYIYCILPLMYSKIRITLKWQNFIKIENLFWKIKIFLRNLFTDNCFVLFCDWYLHFKFFSKKYFPQIFLFV